MENSAPVPVVPGLAGHVKDLNRLGQRQWPHLTPRLETSRVNHGVGPRLPSLANHMDLNGEILEL